MKYAKLFEKIGYLKNGVTKKTDFFIDAENLEIFKGLKDLCQKLECSPQNALVNMAEMRRIKGRYIERFDEWVQWDAWEKERFTKKNNIYFFDRG